MSTLEDFIRQQIESLPYTYGKRIKNNVVWVRCPTHGNGMEKTPSRIVNLTTEGKGGLGHSTCFGCGQNFSWNKFAELTGLKQISQKELDKQEASLGLTRNQLSDLRGTDNSNPFAFLESAIDWQEDEEWRSISGELLSEIGALLYFDEVDQDTKVFLPVNMYDETVGGIRARRKKKKNTISYVNLPGEWVSKSLFPFDYALSLSQDKGLDYIVLVEGPRDALWLLQHGIPAVSIMGSSNSWTKTKADIISSLDISTIVLAFDNDEAGNKAKRKARKDLKPNVDKVVALNLPEGGDPATLTKKQLVAFKKKMRSLTE